jgi:hypothetical protein
MSSTEVEADLAPQALHPLDDRLASAPQRTIEDIQWVGLVILFPYAQVYVNRIKAVVHHLRDYVFDFSSENFSQRSRYPRWIIFFLSALLGFIGSIISFEYLIIEPYLDLYIANDN